MKPHPEPPMPSAAALTRRQFIAATVGAAAAVASSRAASAGGGWEIGCYTRPWPEADYRVALDGMAAAGFTVAGLMTTKSGVLISPQTPPEQVAAMAQEAKKRGLKIASIYGGNFMVKKTVEDGVANLRRLIDHVAACECPSLLLGGTSSADVVDAYYKVVRECCDYGASRGVGMTVKPHGGTNSTGPQCRALIEKVNHPSFRLWYDPGNIFYYSEGKLDPIADSATVDGLVVGMSVKDYLPPKEVNVTPGNGRVDFETVLSRLRRGGFTRGPLLIECLSAGDSAHVTAEAKKAREFMAGLMKRVVGQR